MLMFTTRTALSFSALALLAATGSANITGLTMTSTSNAVQNDVSLGANAFYQTASGVPHTFTSPFDLSTVGTMNYTTMSTNTASVVTNTSTTLDFRSTFAGEVSSYGSPNPDGLGNLVYTGFSTVTLTTMLTFTLTAPGTVQLFSTNSTSNTSVGSMNAAASANKLMWLDGSIEHGTFSDGAYLFAVGAGTHSVQIQESVFANFVSSPLIGSDSAYAYGASRSRVLIQSVPEPGSLLALGALSLMLVARRRGR